jgi:hypothetical protein
MAYQWKPITDWRGGQNSTNDPLSLADNEVVTMRNGDTWRTRLFRKRAGSTSLSIGAIFTGVISSLIAHFPTSVLTAAELWGCDDAATPILGRMAAASTFSTVTQTDTPSAGAGPSVRGVSYKGKLFLAYQSAQDRMHVYDPNATGGARVRRLGIGVPAAPTLADSVTVDGGTFVHYVRVRYRIKNGSVVVAQSEPSASVTFTPHGAPNYYQTVTKPASLSESETHWVIEGSKDNATFYEESEVVVGTTTYQETARYDAASTPQITTFTQSETSGYYTALKSAKYILAAFNRVLFLSAWTASNPQSRVTFTPADGETSRGDDERYVNALARSDWVDLGEGTGGDGRGLIGPMYGSAYAFKYSQIRKLTPTGATAPAFDVIDVSLTHGAVEQECIALGDDVKGLPTIYFLDPQVGPMSVGATYPVSLADQKVQDQWDSVNLAATAKAGWVLDYPAKNQVLFAWATGSNNDPNILATYDKTTGGWAVHDTGGKIRLSRAAVLFGSTLGATMGLSKVPYFAYASANNTLTRGDSGTDDGGTTFQALVKSRPYAFNGGKKFRTTSPLIVAKPSSGVTLTVTVDADLGREVRTSTIDLTAQAHEAGASRIFRFAAGLDLADCRVVQISLQDSAAVANTWTVERVYIPVEPYETDTP